ncbi:MAG: ArsJ-associated glyceraldehyde-3-phosphate dehydrogenase [Roseiflexaceae bacterium]
MSIRVGINGFGRIGRLAMRAAWGWPEITFSHINEIGGDAAVSAHLLAFDSVHGVWDRSVEGAGDRLKIDEHELSHSRVKDLSIWADRGCDIVIESTGVFRSTEQLAPYFAAGVKKVVVAAPVKGDALNIVVGVNDDWYRPAEHHLLTAASCTTNCLAPVVKVIHEGLGIRHGMITTIHSSTNTQSVHDSPHKDLRRARASSLSLVPTTTGSATAIGMIFPELQGKLDGQAVRVPLLNASLTDCVFEVQRPTSVGEVNALLRAAAEGPLKGILAYETRPLVSIDFSGNPHSAIIDALCTMVTNGTQVKIYAWYDNEWGYANRLVELVRKVATSL